MSYQIHVENHWVSFSYRVWLGQHQGNGYLRLFTHGGNGLPHAFIEVAEGTTPPEDGWFCEIPKDAAHQLLGELARVLGAVEHPEQLRRDYEAERGRVDRLIGFMESRLK